MADSGRTLLRQLQIGQQTDIDSQVTPTVLWRGMGVLDDQREVVAPDEHVGYLDGLMRTYVSKLMAAIDLPETPLTFEQAPLLFDIGVENVSGSQDGSGSGYIYTYSLPYNTVPSRAFWTVYGGDDIDQEKTGALFPLEIVISGEAESVWNIAATLNGRTVEQQSGGFESLTASSVEEALFGKTKIFIDDPGSGFGSTQIDSALLSAELALTTGLQARFTPVGDSLYFERVKLVRGPYFEVSFTFEHTADIVSEKSKWRAAQAGSDEAESRLIRLEVLGNALSSPDSESNKRLTVDMPGYWMNFGPLDDEDNNDILEGTFRSKYDSTVGNAGKVEFVNELTDLY